MDYAQGIAFGTCRSLSAVDGEALWLSDEDAYYGSAAIVDFSQVRELVGIWTVRLSSGVSWVCGLVRRPTFAG